VERKQDNTKCTALARRDAMRSAAHGLTAREAGRHSFITPADKPTPQVFISYSQHDRAVAQALASFLADRGIECWWDREILSGEDFACAIETALRAAQAVIVIWSDTAVVKEYVRNEATYARNQDKLITLHLREFDKDRIPIGFILRQSECVENRTRLIQSLARFGIHPRTATGCAGGSS
jgi:hypothetical protein